jgi:hypothetical protein
MKLNLETKTKEQELIKQYLEENASESLAEKINNGVKIQKDNKSLINKKDLNSFMKYASEEARKLAEKGANCACIEDKVVYSWAIHYFEEDSLEGDLYNEDRTEYKVETKKTTTPKVESKKQEKKQETFFDLMNFNTTEKQEKVEIENKEIEQSEPTTEELNTPPIEYEIDEQDNNIEDFSEEEIEEVLEQEAKETTIQNYYKFYHEQELNYPDIVVLTRLGDFYEAFNENAERIAKVLDLTLTRKDVGLQNKIPLAGFPIHIKETYIEKLQKYYTILIIEGENITFYEKIEEKMQKTSNLQSIDKEYMKTLYVLLDNKLTI